MAFPLLVPFFARRNDGEGGLDETCGETNA